MLPEEQSRRYHKGVDHHNVERRPQIFSFEHWCDELMPGHVHAEEHQQEQAHRSSMQRRFSRLLGIPESV
jgi:hypothetical protein